MRPRNATAGTRVSRLAPEQIEAYFRGRREQVLTFVGYYRSDYEHVDEMLSCATDVLAGYASRDTIVNIGAMPDGIGRVYEVAKRMGFPTTGIVSTRALDHDSGFSACVDRVFLVDDPTWGGFLPNTETLSPTSRTVVACTDVMVAIGGNVVTRDEMIATRRLKKPVRYIPAEMNHAIASGSARVGSKRGAPDFRGAAWPVFGAERVGHEP